jgi:hypothetical protein
MTEVDDFAGSAFSADPKADTLPQKGSMTRECTRLPYETMGKGANKVPAALAPYTVHVVARDCCP